MSTTNIDMKYMDKIWALEALAEQQQAEIVSMRNVIYSLQKEVGTASEAARAAEEKVRASLVTVIGSLNDEIEELTDKVSTIFAEMVEMKQLLTPLKEEKENEEAVYRAKAEIAMAEATIEVAKKVIASGGVVKTGYL